MLSTASCRISVWKTALKKRLKLKPWLSPYETTERSGFFRIFSWFFLDFSWISGRNCPFFQNFTRNWNESTPGDESSLACIPEVPGPSSGIHDRSHAAWRVVFSWSHLTFTDDFLISNFNAQDFELSIAVFYSQRVTRRVRGLPEWLLPLSH